jgi:fructose-bisphosphate aldolase class II
MLLNLKDILQIAEEKKIAVGAFNAANLEGLEAILGAAEELGLPVIAQFAQCHENLTPLEVIGPAMVYMAKRAAVPVCVHLDHGETLDYLKKALDIGFTSIMYDGSVLSYDENLKNTRLAVEMAGKAGASVEAELGSMGRRETGSGDTAGEDETKIYTDPELAGEFAAASGIDALACSFGTTHGIYLTEPRLDFSTVSRVRSATGGIPVVMHGGSGVSREDFAKAIRAGVRKINYFTYMDKEGGSAVSAHIERQKGKPLFFSDMAAAARGAMKENVKEAMRIFAMQ